MALFHSQTRRHLIKRVKPFFLSDHGLLKVLTGYNNLQHVIYSLLSGRPVIVMGTTKYQAVMRELLQALNVFVPVVPG